MHRMRARTRRLFVGAALAAFIPGLIMLGGSPADADTDTEKKAEVRDKTYYYSAFNKKDPFASLIVGDFISEKKMTPVELGRVELVGIVRGELDRFAMLEDDKGFGYILRIGDRVKNGSVVAIGDKSMVARVTNFGQTRKVTLHLAKRVEGDKK